MLKGKFETEAWFASFLIIRVADREFVGPGNNPGPRPGPTPVPVHPGPVDRDTADNLLTNNTQNRKI